jgi:ABC-2 type transport system permease protein
MNTLKVHKIPVLIIVMHTYHEIIYNFERFEKNQTMKLPVASSITYVILKKEVASFFSSLSGYVVVILFLIANSLFLWIFPGEYNVLDSGYSGLDTMFMLAPWIFLFLVPAVTMRMFADEKRTGTAELLYTRPLSNIQIIFAKYSAGIVLVFISLLPALVFFVTVGLIGETPWNIDTGAFWGSFIGLFFLACVYVSIGVFASSLTENQIIAFLTAVLISFFFYIGFEAISSLEFWGKSASVIEGLGINSHYKSLSRGVVDSRDVIYFAAVSVIFIVMTKTVLESKK